MELTFNELKKRDVINIADGKSLGNITDLRLSFPDGTLSGIYVPGRKCNRLFRIFDKTVIYIDESRIIKIGGDVILVNLRCTDDCTERIGHGKKTNKDDCSPYKKPPCPPQCPPPCPPKPPKPCVSDEVDFSILSGGAERFDTGDY